MEFKDFWPLVENHGSVAGYYKSEAEALWKTYSPEQQQAIYNAIKEKLDSGRFVHYDPSKAIRDNIPKAPKIQIISADEYYRRYGTQANHDGWVRTFLPEQQKTIYVNH